MKSCNNNPNCEKCAEIIDQILWTSDKEVKLKIPRNETGETGNETGETRNDPSSQSMDFFYYSDNSNLI